MTSICLCHKHLSSWGTETRANKLFQYCKQAAVIFHVCIPRSSFEENCTQSLKQLMQDTYLSSNSGENMKSISVQCVSSAQSRVGMCSQHLSFKNEWSLKVLFGHSALLYHTDDVNLPSTDFQVFLVEGALSFKV